MDGTEPHEFMGFGATDGTKPYEFIGSPAEMQVDYATALYRQTGKRGGQKEDHLAGTISLRKWAPACNGEGGLGPAGAPL